MDCQTPHLLVKKLNQFIINLVTTDWMSETTAPYDVLVFFV